VEIFDIKAFDVEKQLMFKIQTEVGQKGRIIKSDIDFHLEIHDYDVDTLQTYLEDVVWADGIEFSDRGWETSERGKLISVKYPTIEQKNLLLRTFGDEILFFNADIKEEFQYILEKKYIPANFMVKPLWFDIESDPTKMKSRWKSSDPAVKFGNRIYMVGMSDLRGGYFPIVDRDEKKLLRTAFAYASKYSCLIGWNSGGRKTSFDIPMLQGRSDLLGLKLPWDKLPHLDMMYTFKDYMKFKKELGEVVTYGLDAAGERLLGRGKSDPIAYGKLNEWFKNDWLSLETYCMNDVLLMIDMYNAVDGLRNGMNVEVNKRQLAYLSPNDRYVSSFVDNKFTEFAFEDKIAVPMRGKWCHRDTGVQCVVCDVENDFDAEVCINCKTSMKESRGVGGAVPDPELGLSHNTIFVDFESLYPTIYMTHNIGINTVDWLEEDENPILTEELQYRRDARGLNAKFMEWLLVSRKEFRKKRDDFAKGTDDYIFYDMRQQALKDILVSANGVLEEKNFRYKSRPIYDSCTKTGQVYLGFLLEAGEKLGLKLKQADTDGIHFTTPYGSPEEIVKKLPEIEKFMYEYVKEKAMAKWNLPEEWYAIYPRCEKVCSHFFSIAKKSYIMKIVYDDGKWLERFDAKGMPGVKYNTLPLLKEILKNIFKKVIFEVPEGEDYVDACVDYLLRLKDDLYSGRIDDLLIFSQQVNALGGRLPHDRAAAKLEKLGKFDEGMIIRFIRRKSGQIVLPEEEEVDIDLGTYENYWVGSVGSWMNRLLPEVAGIKELGFKVAMKSQTLGWL
jgi:DNA polymerase elongation subunit (family B)